VSPIHLELPRNLQLTSAELHIKLTKPPYTSSNTVVSLSDPCTVSSHLACIVDSSNASNSIPTAISIPISGSSSYLEYHYNGYFENPISLDIYYTTPNFIRDYYSQQNLAGGVTSSTTIPSLNFSGPSLESSYRIYGYLLGPVSGVVNFNIYHDDGACFKINGVTVYQNNQFGQGNFSYTFLERANYFVEVELNDIGGHVNLEITWDIGGGSVITSDYILLPNRVAGLPYNLNGLKYNTYCDDVSGFKCVVCDGLCVKCSYNSSMKVCETCKQNAFVIKIIQRYEYSFYLRFMIQGYLEIGIAASFTLKYFPYSYEVIDYILAVISLVILT
jgi:hypothetical protein